MGEYITGTGQKLIFVHDKTSECLHGCAIHSPSDHPMRAFPTHWREDRRLMERICPHGVGHPDPDHLSYIRRTKGASVAATEGIHGCDGCCSMEWVKEKEGRFALNSRMLDNWSVSEAPDEEMVVLVLADSEVELYFQEFGKTFFIFYRHVHVWMAKTLE